MIETRMNSKWFDFKELLSIIISMLWKRERKSLSLRERRQDPLSLCERRKSHQNLAFSYFLHLCGSRGFLQSTTNSKQVRRKSKVNPNSAHWGVRCCSHFPGSFLTNGVPGEYNWLIQLGYTTRPQNQTIRLTQSSPRVLYFPPLMAGQSFPRISEPMTS